jgi:serine/threonine-protein kinase
MEAGQVISGKYRLLRHIGDGGMGVVYEAHHEVLGANVAIKVLHDELARKPELVDRFLREARVLAQIKSPHVVRVLDIAMPEGDRSAYIVMELLAGEPLSALLAREPRLPLPVAVDYALQVLEALGAAHALGVVHRDLKPENVFITREGDRPLLKLIDFGIAKAGIHAGGSANLTVSGALMGTPEYMAPEQAHSADKADARSDVYAVGVMLYEMLAGARPVDGDDPRLVALKVERGDVHPLIHRAPDIPRELAGLVHRAMAPRPELRFASAAEMRTALEAVMAAKRASVSPPSSRAPSTTPDPLDPRGSATAFEPHGERSSARPPMTGTDPGERPNPSNRPPYAVAAGTDPANAALGGAWTPPPPPAFSAARTSRPSPASPVRGRRRGGVGTVWILAGVTVLLGAGLGLAFTFTGSSSGGPGKSRPVTRVDVPSDPSVATTTTPPNPSATEVPMDPSLGPLPVGPTATHLTGKEPVAPPGPRPGASASGAPSAVAQSSATPLNPLGLPPFVIPTSLPNPFPNPASSGLGPILTIPTVFPPFGFPPDPGASAPPAQPPPSGSSPRRQR